MVRHYRDLIAWQLAEQFKEEVFRLIGQSEAARRNFRYSDQLIDAAGSVSTNICEGFMRPAADCCRFLDYALGSLLEAETRLADGAKLGYFPLADCEIAFKLARRCLTACVRFKTSQRRYLREQKKQAGK